MGGLRNGGLNTGSEPCAVNKIGEVNITMLCLTQALDRHSLNFLLRSVKGAVASEGVRQGQVPIMRIIGKGGFSKNNGEIGAPIIFALKNRLACPVFHSPQADERCRTPEPLPLFYSPLGRATFLLGWWAGEETRNLAPQTHA